MSTCTISLAGDFAMAEIERLSVGKALDKLRGTDLPASRMKSLDEKIDALNKETQRMKALRLRVERDQQAASAGRDTPEANKKRIAKLKPSGIIVGIAIVIFSLAWTCWKFL